VVARASRAADPRWGEQVVLAHQPQYPDPGPKSGAGPAGGLVLTHVVQPQGFTPTSDQFSPPIDNLGFKRKEQGSPVSYPAPKPTSLRHGKCRRTSSRTVLTGVTCAYVLWSVSRWVKP
jgi:hypothetical protein